MKMRHRGMLLLVGMLVLAGLIGCEIAEDDSSGPTVPSSAAPPVGNLANFYTTTPVNVPSDNKIGVHSTTGEFVLILPPGDYLVGYETESGQYTTVMRVTKTDAVHICLLNEEEVINAALLEVRILTIPDEAQTYGHVTLVDWPGREFDFGDQPLLAFDGELPPEIMYYLEPVE